LEDGAWEGGGIAEIITADAKNGTAIAAVAYAMVSEWTPPQPIGWAYRLTRMIRQLGISSTSTRRIWSDRRHLLM
jgi:hypothetical protein